jgi:hypothetical protein
MLKYKAIFDFWIWSKLTKNAAAPFVCACASRSVALLGTMQV